LNATHCLASYIWCTHINSCQVPYHSNNCLISSPRLSIRQVRFIQTLSHVTAHKLIQLMKVPALDPHQNVDQIQQRDRLKPFFNWILQQTCKIRRTCNATSSSIIHHQFYLHVLHYKLKPSNHQDFISTYWLLNSTFKNNIKTK
jgi:hypothetical protein